MQPKNQEQLYASLQKGLLAASELQVAAPLLEARKEQLITQAINDFNARPPKLGEREALLFVAALAENQRLMDDLKAAVTTGRRDGAKLTG